MTTLTIYPLFPLMIGSVEMFCFFLFMVIPIIIAIILIVKIITDVRALSQTRSQAQLQLQTNHQYTYTGIVPDCENSTYNKIVVNEQRQSNGIGTAGFIFAILALILLWAPVLRFIVWFLGGLFSFIGLFKRPKGLAVAGFIISNIVIIIILSILGVFSLVF